MAIEQPVCNLSMYVAFSANVISRNSLKGVSIFCGVIKNFTRLLLLSAAIGVKTGGIVERSEVERLSSLTHNQSSTTDIAQRHSNLAVSEHQPQCLRGSPYLFRSSPPQFSCTYYCRVRRNSPYSWVGESTNALPISNDYFGTFLFSSNERSANFPPIFREVILPDEREGAALAVYYKGQLVVDLWGGFADRSALRRWESDTMTVVYSSTKAIGATMIAMLVSRGHLQYEDLVTKYWPEFGKNGKQNVTVDWLMGHKVSAISSCPSCLHKLFRWALSCWTVR